MSLLRTRTKQLLERLSGCSIVLPGGRSLVLLDKRQPHDGWFLYAAQLKAILDRLAINLVLDVGANVGRFATQARSVYAGPIISYEPVASEVSRLRDAAAGDPHWQVRDFALGSREATATITIPPATEFSSLLRTSDYSADRFGSRVIGVREETVRVRRLDEALREDVPDLESRRLFVKIDTQGYDLEVFAGMSGILDRVVAIQSEVSLVPIYDGMPHWTESITTYERAGFAVAGMFPVAWGAHTIIEYDCLLVRNEHAAAPAASG